MRLVNLTPHPITIVGENGLKITIKNDHPPARVIQDENSTTVDIPIADNITMGVRVRESVGSRIVGLPEPEEGTIYIVSTLVAQLARRKDALAPLTDHTAERDSDENVIGVRGFRRFV